MTNRWFSTHTHSHRSTLDGTTDVASLVAAAHANGYPAYGQCDHGNMGGVTEAYLECAKVGIPFFPGVEAYLVDPDYAGSMDDKEFGTQERFHLCLYARNLEGYKALVRLVSLTHTRPRFNRFARMTYDDLIQLGKDHGDDIILTTGCYFGLVQQRMVHAPTHAEGIEAATQAVRAYSAYFPHTFVEVQHHNIDHSNDGDAASTWDDSSIVVALMEIAAELGLPVIAGQDTHYLNTRDRKSHGLMKRLVYGGADDAFPGDSFHLASEEWVAEHYTDEQWAEILDGHDAFLALHDLQIPLLDTFVPQVPQVVDDSGQVVDPEPHIVKTCTEWLINYCAGFSKAKQRRYEDRMVYELSVIRALGMFGYLAIVDDYVRWCARETIAIEARGSANASLVCFAVGITQVDPLEWGSADGLMFERFLSLDRTKPPDVDMDVERSEHARLIAYLMNKYGALRIGTFNGLGIDDTGKGSVLVTYRSSIMRGVGDPKQRAEYTAKTRDMDAVREHFPADHEPLTRLGDMQVFKSYGVHPGGVLLPGDNVDVHDVVPTMLVASSNTTVSQFDMDAVENWGFLKLDVLSQATLTVMKRCQQLIGRADPTDFSWIPLNDREACKLLREGRTGNGLFHFEGASKAIGGKEMGVRSTKDAILATALYMPGAKDSGQTQWFLDRRRDRDLRARTKYLHPVFEKHLKATHGAVVFQEQVMGIWIDLGMTTASANAVLKVMKTSGKKSAGNAAKIAKLRAEFEECCRVAGITDVDAAWDGTAGFASYGFNEAHASGYGIRSYRTAYLKAHYPHEYMTALLQVWAGDDKEIVYAREARRIGLRITNADVNTSGVSWTIGTRGKIQRGLVSIKGIGLSAAREIVQHAPYKNIDQLCTKLPPRAVTGGKHYIQTGEFTGNLGVLARAGALRSLGIGPTEV